MLEELLQVLRARPRTLRELPQLLGASAGQIESALLQLRRGGYVDRAIPDQGSCRSGCGHCSVKNFCPTTSTGEQGGSGGTGGARSAQPKQSPLDPGAAEETWRLTDKALSRVAPPA